MKIRPLFLPIPPIIPKLGLAILLIFGGYGIRAQDSLKTLHISLEQAKQMGLQNSKMLKMSQAKINEAAARVLETGDAQLPSAKANLAYSEAALLTHTLNIPGVAHPLELPTWNPFNLGTVSVEEVLFAGNKLKYAKQSAQLMVQIASLNAENDKQTILLDIISEYYNLLKVRESQRIVDSSMADINARLNEEQKFLDQGLATRNDVLRWQLQQSNTAITALELEDNRKDIIYDLDLLLGLPTHTWLDVDTTMLTEGTPGPLADYIREADSSRSDLAVFNYQNQVADLNIRQIKGSKAPTIAAAMDLYYVNPNYSPIPPAGSLFLVPVTLGLAASWDIGTLWTTRHKMMEAKVQQQETQIGLGETQDQVSSQVNKSYTNYLEALKKIDLLAIAVDQAVENDRIMESKYQNQLATTTDRIDAHAQLYQVQINLQMARVDARIAYYQLLQSTGTLK